MLTTVCTRVRGIHEENLCRFCILDSLPKAGTELYAMVVACVSVLMRMLCGCVNVTVYFVNTMSEEGTEFKLQMYCIGNA